MNDKLLGSQIHALDGAGPSSGTGVSFGQAIESIDSELRARPMLKACDRHVDSSAPPKGNVDAEQVDIDRCRYGLWSGL